VQLGWAEWLRVRNHAAGVCECDGLGWASGDLDVAEGVVVVGSASALRVEVVEVVGG